VLPRSRNSRRMKSVRKPLTYTYIYITYTYIYTYTYTVLLCCIYSAIYAREHIYTYNIIQIDGYYSRCYQNHLLQPSCLSFPTEKYARAAFKDRINSDRRYYTILLFRTTFFISSWIAPPSVARAPRGLTTYISYYVGCCGRNDGYNILKYTMHIIIYWKKKPDI